jgi:hypothetical protein
MPIIAKRPDDFAPAPIGDWAAICVDVEDLGQRPNPFRPEVQQQKIRISWQLAKRTPDGRPYLVSRIYSLSLHEKSTLLQHIEAWLGKPLTPSELKGFNVETLIGKPGTLSLSHRPKPDGRIFADVDSISPLPKNVSAPQVDGYVRKIDRSLVSAPRGSKGGTAAADHAVGEDAPAGHEAPAPDDAMLDRESSERDDKEWN